MPPSWKPGQKGAAVVMQRVRTIIGNRLPLRCQNAKRGGRHGSRGWDWFHKELDERKVSRNLSDNDDDERRTMMNSFKILFLFVSLTLSLSLETETSKNSSCFTLSAIESGNAYEKESIFFVSI